MTYILVAMSDPAAPALDPQFTDAIAHAAHPATNFRWLDAGIACEWRLASETRERADAAATRAREAMGTAPVDIAVVRDENRRKKLFLADMDSTIIGQECIDELGAVAGFGEEIAAITERAMRGELDFAEALRERVGLMRGLEESLIQDVIETRITVNPGAVRAIATMRAAGVVTVLVSGGFTVFTRSVAQRVGFDRHHGNTLLIEDGRLTGRVAEPILSRTAKRETLARYCGELGIDEQQALATGDGANDLDMLDAAGLGVAYRAKPVVAERADARLAHTDLTGLLYLQGYAAADFAA